MHPATVGIGLSTFFLTLSSAFLILKDCRRKRLSGRLMPLKPASTPDKYEENAVRAAIAAAIPAARWR